MENNVKRHMGIKAKNTISNTIIYIILIATLILFACITFISDIFFSFNDFFKIIHYSIIPFSYKSLNINLSTGEILCKSP